MSKSMPNLPLHPQLVSHPFLLCCHRCRGRDSLTVPQVRVTRGAPSGGASALLVLFDGFPDLGRVVEV